MLVNFHSRIFGYTKLEIAFLFLFYEFFGVIFNLYAGWIGTRYVLRLTLWVRTLLQIGALLILFGFIFAMNSSIHTYMFLPYTDKENMILNVGFYHMANATG